MYKLVKQAHRGQQEAIIEDNLETLAEAAGRYCDWAVIQLHALMAERSLSDDLIGACLKVEDTLGSIGDRLSETNAQGLFSQALDLVRSLTEVFELRGVKGERVTYLAALDVSA